MAVDDDGHLRAEISVRLQCRLLLKDRVARLRLRLEALFRRGEGVPGHPGCPAQGQFCLNVVGARLEPARWKEAEEHLGASLSAFEASEARLEAANTHVAWGRVLHARGNDGAARDHFEQAAAQFETSGLGQPLDETRGLIATLPAD